MDIVHEGCFRLRWPFGWPNKTTNRGLAPAAAAALLIYI
jgi:hypothetical protein